MHRLGILEPAPRGAVAGLMAAAIGIAACSESSGGDRATGGSTSSTGAGAGGGAVASASVTGAGGSIVVPAGTGTGTGTGSGGATGNQDAAVIVGPLPADFVMTQVGGYKLGPPVGANGSQTGLEGKPNCNMIVGVVRDFKSYPSGHPDFEHFTGADPTLELVGPNLGADLKPVYASKCEVPNPPILRLCPTGQMTTGKANFDQWYRFDEAVNKPYLVYFMFGQAPGSNVITFSSDFFFPLDGAGWGDPPAMGNDMKPHNFSFTTELHTKFKYNGAETFKFLGDDDLWVFINGKLVIDLGGLHGPLERTVNLDDSATMLGITKGNDYTLDLFHAERHTTASHFRLDTTLTLVECGTIPPDIPR